jgi:hypothetical protein
MARSKAVLGNGARLADYLSASLLARVVPAQVVHEVLDAHGCNSKRIRSFPAVAGAYYCMALSLYPEAAYEEVFAVVAQGLAWAAGAAEPARVAKSSISALRTRIGPAPIKDLVQRCCVPLLDPERHPHGFYAGLRLVALDGSCFELSDEAGIVEAFGRPGSRTGFSAYPQARCAVLVECGSHAILGANLDAYRTDEWQVCAPLLEHLQPDMLCLADRGFDGFVYWQQARERGVQLLWRCMKDRTLPVLRELDDGSYLSAICPPSSARGRAQATQESIIVRVIEYSLPGVPAAAGLDAPEPRYRLITSLLDPATAPARELAALYHERWHVEGVFDEMKTHLLQARRVLRSKTADLVRQEFYGWVLAHYAVRWLLHQGADLHGVAHRERSFSGHLQLMRRTQPLSGAFSPRAAQKAKPLAT